MTTVATDFYVTAITKETIGNIEWVIAGDGEPLYEMELDVILNDLEKIAGKTIVSKRIGSFSEDNSFDNWKPWRDYPITFKGKVSTEMIPIGFLARGRFIPKGL